MNITEHGWRSHWRTNAEIIAPQSLWKTAINGIQKSLENKNNASEKHTIVLDTFPRIVFIFISVDKDTINNFKGIKYFLDKHLIWTF